MAMACHNNVKHHRAIIGGIIIYYDRYVDALSSHSRKLRGRKGSFYYK
jgi:hypothetical protein